MAAAIGDKEADRAAAGPILVVPGLRVLPLDAAPQGLQPLPEELGCFGDLFLGDGVADDDGAVLVEVGQPLGLFVQGEGVIL